MHHPSAIIDPSAKIDESVEIGPFSLIGPDVTIGKDTRIESHAILKGPTIIGERNHVFQFSTVGDGSPDKKYKNEPTLLKIGDDNIIREGVTIHRGTIQDKGETHIGNRNLIMAYSHVAHDCIVGDNVIMANIATLGGHVEIGNWCNIGGGAMIHQFVKIGQHSLIGGGFAAKQDVPPFIIGAGIPLRFIGINKIGLERRGFGDEKTALIKKAYRTYFKSKLNRGEAIQKIKNELQQTKEIKEIIKFIESSNRGII